MEEQFLGIALDGGVDFEAAKFMWEASSGDFDRAMELLSQQKQLEKSSSTNTGGGANDPDHVRAPIAPTRKMRLVDDNVIHYRPPQPRAREFNPFAHDAAPMGRGPSSEKAELLERLYRPPTDIMFIGDFNQAVGLAEQSKRWLLVNLQDPTEFQCQIINRDVWSNQQLKAFVQKHFVFWQPTSTSEEGKYYLRFYPNVGRYPHLSVIDPETRFQSAVFEGVATFNEVRQKLTEFLNSHGSEIDAAIVDDAESLRHSMSASERSELQRAIEESMKDVDVQDVEGMEKEQAPKRQKRSNSGPKNGGYKEIEGEEDFFDPGDDEDDEDFHFYDGLDEDEEEGAPLKGAKRERGKTGGEGGGGVPSDEEMLQRAISESLMDMEKANQKQAAEKAKKVEEPAPKKSRVSQKKEEKVVEPSPQKDGKRGKEEKVVEPLADEASRKRKKKGFEEKVVAPPSPKEGWEDKVVDAEPAGVDQPPDTTIRVRNSDGAKLVKIHSDDTLERLFYVVTRDLEMKDVFWKDIELSTVMPKVYITSLNPLSLVREHGLNGSTLVLTLKEK